jgi:hypothetical protein
VRAKTPLAEVFFSSPATAPENMLDAEWMTGPLGTPRGRCDEYSSKIFPQYETKFYRSGEEQTNDWRWCPLACDSSGQFIGRLVQALLCERQRGTWTQHNQILCSQLTMRLSGGVCLGFFWLSSRISRWIETNGWLCRVLLPKPKQRIGRASKAPFEVLPAASRIRAEPVHLITHSVCSIYDGMPPCLSRIVFRTLPVAPKYRISSVAACLVGSWTLAS